MIFFVIMVISLNFLATAKENERWFAQKKDEPPHVGNFALPASQQAGPLVAFGQNMPEKGVFQLFLYGSQLKGTKRSFSEVIPLILYGITDRLSVFIELPVAVKFKEDQLISRGLSDLIVQFEGVTYIKETKTMVNEITFVGNMSFPTGSPNKQPATGSGSPRFLLGVTASHSDEAWYYFTSMGGVITTSHKDVKAGNQFLYQFGLSRNIAYKTDTWILNWMVEFDGIYEQRSKTAGIAQCNTGSNTLLLGPSLWFSTQKFIFQGGASVIVSDHVFGVQPKNQYIVAAYVGWTF